MRRLRRPLLGILRLREVLAADEYAGEPAVGWIESSSPGLQWLRLHRPSDESALEGDREEAEG